MQIGRIKMHCKLLIIRELQEFQDIINQHFKM